MDRSEPKESNSDPYRSVVIVLLAAAVLGAAGAVGGGFQLSSPVLFAVALTLGLLAGVLTGVATSQAMRLLPPQSAELSLSLALEEPAALGAAGEASEDAAAELRAGAKLRSRLATISRKMALWNRGGETLVRIRRWDP